MAYCDLEAGDTQSLRLEWGDPGWNNSSLIEPFHGKTYNLDWRHNMLKRRHKLAGENPDL